MKKLTETQRDILTIFTECTIACLFGCIIVLVDVKDMEPVFYSWGLLLIPISLLFKFIIWEGFEDRNSEW